MYLAVAQLTVVEVGFFAALTGQLGHASHSFAFAFALAHLLEYYLCHIGCAAQVVIDLFLDEVADELINTDAAAIGLGAC